MGSVMTSSSAGHTFNARDPLVIQVTMLNPGPGGSPAGLWQASFVLSLAHAVLNLAPPVLKRAPNVAKIALQVRGKGNPASEVRGMGSGLGLRKGGLCRHLGRVPNCLLSAGIICWSDRVPTWNNAYASGCRFFVASGDNEDFFYPSDPYDYPWGSCQGGMPHCSATNPLFTVIQSRLVALSPVDAVHCYQKVRVRVRVSRGSLPRRRGPLLPEGK
jgi:hypothetical protein